MSKLEDTYLQLLKYATIPEPVIEHKFCPTRRFRFDMAWPDKMIAVEIEGGTWTGGRHTQGSGFERDCEKYNLAAMMGWKVFRFTSKMVNNGIALTVTQEALKNEPSPIR